MRERLNELDQNKTIVEYCQVGMRGYIADRILSQNGYNVLNVTGDTKLHPCLAFNPKKPSNKEENREGNSMDIIIDPDTQAVKKN